MPAHLGQRTVALTALAVGVALFASASAHARSVTRGVVEPRKGAAQANDADRAYALRELGPFDDEHLFGTDGPKPLDVEQGRTAGDCYLLAANGSLAKVSPETVRNVFLRGADGKLELDDDGRPQAQFYERQADGTVYRHLVPVESKLPVHDWLDVSPASTPVYVRDTHEPRNAQIVQGKAWVAAIEAAYRDFRARLLPPLQVFDALGNRRVVERSERQKSELLRQGYANVALEHLTGMRSGFAEFSPTPADAAALFRNIERGLSLERPMVLAGVDREGTVKRMQQALKSGLISAPRAGWVDGEGHTGRHAYAVLAVRTDPDGQHFVQVANPWRRSFFEPRGGLNLTKGIRWIPMDEVATTFRELQYGRTGVRPGDVAKLSKVLGPDGRSANWSQNSTLILPQLSRPTAQPLILRRDSPR